MAATEKEEGSLSPTVTKVLDEYLGALKSDPDIENEAADRLDALLRRGKPLKSEEIDAALFPTQNGANS